MPISVKDVSLFHKLSSREIRQVKGCLTEKSFKKGEALFLEGSPCERIFIVREGRVKLYRTAASGREQTLEILGPGDTCACHPGSREWFCSSAAEAISPCKVWFLSKEKYAQLIRKNAKISAALNELLADKLQCMTSLLEEVSLKDSRKRLVKFLLDALGRSSASNRLVLPYTREELAQQLGLARETVARQLSLLKQQRLIDVKGREITVRDGEGLEKLLR